MKLIHKILGLLAVIALTVTAMSYVLDGTIFSADYLKAKVDTGNFSTELADKLPELIAPHDTQTQVLLAGLVSPTDVKSQLSNLLVQLQAHYKSDGPTPHLDLGSITAKIRSQELIVPPGLVPEQITVPDPPNAGNIRWLLRFAATAKLLGVVASVVLLLLLFVTAHGWHRYLGLAKVFILAALAQGGLWLASQAGPSLLTSLVGTSQIGPLGSALTILFKSISSDVSDNFAKLALAFLAAAVACILIGLIARIGHHHGRHGTESMSFRPTPDNRMHLD